MVTWIIVWLLFAFAAGSIAQARGYSTLLWFLCGLFFGPFGLVVAFFPPKVASKPSMVATTARLRKCPLCAEEILAEAIKCKHCGSDVLPLPIAPQAVYVPPPNLTPEQVAKKRADRNFMIMLIGGLSLLLIVGMYVTRVYR